MSENIAQTLPQTGYLRLRQVLQFIPVSKTRWYVGMQSGEFPRPLKIGRTALYKVEDIGKVIEQIAAQAEQQ